MLSLFRFSRPAWAHGTVIEYRPAAGFEVVARYDDGTPMAEAQVAVFAPDNLREPHSRALTDAEGRFGFIPQHRAIGRCKCVRRGMALW
ncbi:MAG: hypothetical protein HC926_06190 [Synechococcaceae cyanobacterium SM2_3_60]|nr:hypothetical protein [Synechococcaceae cyanobacterium SM2_3_60]